MEELVLKSIKLSLGLQADYAPFDVELLMSINSAVSNLAQLGVGNPEGTIVDTTTTWDQILDDKAKLNDARTYVYLRVKMLFDSNGMTSHVISATEKMIEEAAWRLSVTADPKIPQQPSFDPDEDVYFVLDGGDP